MTEQEFREAFREAVALADIDPGRASNFDEDLAIPLLWEGTAKPALSDAREEGYNEGYYAGHGRYREGQ